MRISSIERFKDHEDKEQVRVTTGNGNRINLHADIGQKHPRDMTDEEIRSHFSNK